MNRADLKKLVHSEFLKSTESLSLAIPEKLKENTNSNGKVDMAGIITLCLDLSADIACDAVLHVLESVLPLAD